MNTKRVAGFLCLLAVIVAAAIVFERVVEDGLHARHAAIQRYEAEQEAEVARLSKRILAFEKKLRRAGTKVSEWNAIGKELASLPKTVQKVLSPSVLARTLEARAIERDGLLVAVRNLITSDEYDPTAKEYFEKARTLHEENMRIIDAIPFRKNDYGWNARLAYRFGVEYSRFPLFLPPTDLAQTVDAIDQAIRSFERVFPYSRKNRDAETAIELLYEPAKKAKEKASSGKDAKEETLKEKLQMFPGEEENPGTGKEGREGGRH